MRVLLGMDHHHHHKSILIVATFLIVAIVDVVVMADGGVGVNWGTQASQNLHPKTIAQMLKDNKISKVKLFDSDYNTVKHFAKTGIEVMLGIPNNQLESLGSSHKAKKWVKDNVKKHLHEGVQIKYIAVGNEPFLKAYNGSNLNTVFPALKNIQNALHDEGLGDEIKATIPQNADVYDSGTEGPSAGDFRSDIRDLMKEIVQHLRDNNVPFLVNIYPFLSLYQNKDFPVDFAFFDGGATPVQDKDISYTNMLDANLDTLVWSLRKAEAPDVKIIIGEIGWPTDGSQNANVAMAERFYHGFFKKMATKKGTPLYPRDIEYYLFSLTDENQKSIDPGQFERHWGIFQYDGQPKFPIDFSGTGHTHMPVGAKDVKYQEPKWCVFNSDIKIMDKVPRNVDYACSHSDCTCLNDGGSCHSLDEVGKISYAFNSYFQMNNQDVEACNFEGLAKIVQTNLTNKNCLFPIAIQASDGWRVLGMQMGTSIVVGLSMALLLLF